MLIPCNYTYINVFFCNEARTRVNLKLVEEEEKSHFYVTILLQTCKMEEIGIKSEIGGGGELEEGNSIHIIRYYT